MAHRGVQLATLLLTSVMAFAGPIDAMAGRGGGGGGGHGGGGGGGHGGGGGGGGAHFGGGGGGVHFGGGGGGVPLGGGGIHLGGGGFHLGGGGFHLGGGGMRFGGGGFHFGSGGAAHVRARSSVSHLASRPAFSGHRAFEEHTTPGEAVERRATGTANRDEQRGASRHANVHANAVRTTLNSRSVEGALHNARGLRNPVTRAHITAVAATAGWHNGREGGRGWWRHGNGGYGWVGPLYWPFAYNDIYGYALWGDDYDDLFWGYGYGDIYAGLFAPYGYDDLTGYLPQYAGTNRYSAAGGGERASAVAETEGGAGALTQMCGPDKADIAGLPIDQIAQIIQLNDAQRAALDALANASAKAAQDIRAACPADIALTAPGRLAHMQQRIEAMIAAVDTVQAPLQQFFSLLSDEQKLKLTALGTDQRRSREAAGSTGVIAANCGAVQPDATKFPIAEIDRTVRPTPSQREALETLEDDAAKAADMLKASCPSVEPLTPPARLAAVRTRLDSLLQAVKAVRSGLDRFYDELNDEQKARFEAIGQGPAGGPERTSESDRPKARQGHYLHYRGHRIGSIEGGVENLIRQLLPF